MAIHPTSELRDVHGISDEQKALIKAFLQGAVYCWAKNQPGRQFAARDLVGGVNFEWKGTPLCPLYEKHLAKGKSHDDALNAAAKDAGWLLKSVLEEDKRNFTAGDAGLAAGYTWVGGEP